MRARFLPYARQHLSSADVREVVRVLRSDWWTQGPAVPAFEAALARLSGAREAVACSSGTAALHLAMLALDLGPGDAVATAANTFLASANCARFVGADVVFVDIEPATGLMDPAALARVLRADRRRRIKAVVPVHFAGQPADLQRIAALARRHGAAVVDDACHAVGAAYRHRGRRVPVGGGAHSAMTAFSFHPVKHVAMGEGGAVTTSDPKLGERLRLLRTHGMTKTGFQLPELARSAEGAPNPWYYEMQALGYNYRLTDIQAALGSSQLKRLPWSLRRRRRVADTYRRLIRSRFPDGTVVPLETAAGAEHAYHLFVVWIDFKAIGRSRAKVMERLRSDGIGTQVHYIPVHLQPYYRKASGTRPGDCPGAERYYEGALSLPMYPDLTPVDCRRVVAALRAALA